MAVTDEMRGRYRDAHRRVQEALAAALSADRERERAERMLRALRDEARAACAVMGSDPLLLAERIGDGSARPVLRPAPIDLPSAQTRRRDTPSRPRPVSPPPTDARGRLLAALREVLPTSAPGLARAAGVDVPTARELIRQLQAAGLIRPIGRRRDADGILLTNYDLVERP